MLLLQLPTYTPVIPLFFPFETSSLLRTVGGEGGGGVEVVVVVGYRLSQNSPFFSHVERCCVNRLYPFPKETPNHSPNIYSSTHPRIYASTHQPTNSLARPFYCISTV